MRQVVEDEINYLYRKNWKDPEYKKDASLEHMMKFLIKKGYHDPVAMYFRNDYMQKYEECPDNVLDLYVTECCIVMLAVAFARLQHGLKENLSSVAYLT